MMGLFMQKDNVIYLQPKMPPDFKPLADAYFAEMRRLKENKQEFGGSDG